MIAIAEERIDFFTTSQKLEDLFLGDLPIKFFPEEQYIVTKGEGERIYSFLNLPKDKVLKYLDKLETQSILTFEDKYEVRNTNTRKFIRIRINGKIRNL